MKKIIKNYQNGKNTIFSLIFSHKPFVYSLKLTYRYCTNSTSFTIHTSLKKINFFRQKRFFNFSVKSIHTTLLHLLVSASKTSTVSKRSLPLYPPMAKSLFFITATPKKYEVNKYFVLILKHSRLENLKIFLTKIHFFQFQKWPKIFS